MANILREHRTRRDDGRAVLQQLFRSTADIIPDYQQNTLTILLHYPASHAQAEAFNKLAEELNSTETQFSGTELTLCYKVGT